MIFLKRERGKGTKDVPSEEHVKNGKEVSMTDNFLNLPGYGELYAVYCEGTLYPSRRAGYWWKRWGLDKDMDKRRRFCEALVRYKDDVLKRRRPRLTWHYFVMEKWLDYLI